MKIIYKELLSSIYPYQVEIWDDVSLSLISIDCSDWLMNNVDLGNILPTHYKNIPGVYCIEYDNVVKTWSIKFDPHNGSRHPIFTVGFKYESDYTWFIMNFVPSC